MSETAIAFAGAGRASTETGIAFAGTGRASTETAIAFAGAGRASTETAIAFAGENWVFLARFSLALVLSVSMGVVQGRALVIVVSRWPVSVVAEVSLASPSHLSASFARKSSPCVLIMAQNWRFLACWANFFAGGALEGRAGRTISRLRARHCHRPHGQALQGLRHPPHR